MGAAAARAGAAAPRRAPARPAPAGGERRLTLVATSRRRWRLRRARWGLVAGAFLLVGIMWVGLMQLRLTTQTGVIEQQLREVSAETQTLKNRFAIREGEVPGQAQASLGMIRGTPSGTTQIRVK